MGGMCRRLRVEVRAGVGVFVFQRLHGIELQRERLRRTDSTPRSVCPRGERSIDA